MNSSLPLLQIVPSNAFANLAKLKSVDLDIAYPNSIMNCESLENLDLHSLERIFFEVSCPTLNPADFSCPEIPNAFCSTYPMATEM
ncbi:hypothetical protein M9Y10_016875 [Tritrichomonas musculus]|uniref:Uncharacterized protein n=1 Tax=Tritrichomonas musculus TaxID=1915356 RepID=A0ABR2HXI9_9EUKA